MNNKKNLLINNDIEKIYNCKITIRNLVQNDRTNSVIVYIFNEKFGSDEYPFYYYPFDELVEYEYTIDIAYNETKTFEIEIPQSKILGINSNGGFRVWFSNTSIDGVCSTDSNTGGGLVTLFYNIESNLIISMDRTS